MSAPYTEMLAPSWQRERAGWVTEAACVGADPELWFPPHMDSFQVTQAKRICGECPVRRECLAFSDSQEPTRDNHGIWGGLTPAQRLHRRLDRKRKGMTPAVVEFVVEIPDSAWLSENGSQPHWTDRKRRVRDLNWLGLAAWRNAGSPRFKKVRADAFIQFRSSGRADPNNASPTTKALIDGMTRGGMVPDDDSKHVLGPDHRHEKGRAPAGIRRVRFVLTDQDVIF